VSWCGGRLTHNVTVNREQQRVVASLSSRQRMNVDRSFTCHSSGQKGWMTRPLSRSSPTSLGNLAIHSTRYSGVRAYGSGSDEDNKVEYNTEFGYSRKDIILIGAGMFGLGFGLYYGLQAAFGMDAIMAGNYAQLIIFVGLCFGWVGSYLFRVATKQMTYAKQLEDYEEAVMQKRLEELPETELENIMQEIRPDDKESSSSSP
jgi:hypothetical protein